MYIYSITGKKNRMNIFNIFNIFNFFASRAKHNAQDYLKRFTIISLSFLICTTDATAFLFRELEYLTRHSYYVLTICNSYVIVSSTVY